MSSSAPVKRLTYIVNYLSANDAQHYAHIPNLLTEMEKLGWEIDLVSEKGGLGAVEVLGRRVTYLTQAGRWRRIPGLVSHLLRMRADGGRLVFVRISKWSALLSAVLGRLLGWKTVYWLSGAIEDFNLRRGIRARVAMAGMWILFRLIDRLATGPETMVDYYARLYGLSRRKILMLYNDIELKEMRRPKARPDRPPRVLMVHRLSPVRETARYFPSLLDALERLAASRRQPAALDICGDGPERPELEGLAPQSLSHVEVHFHGAIPQRQLGAFYERATIFVMPSYREGFPRVVIEAMAQGLPIVATDAGGTRDIFGPAQQDYVIDRDDAQGFGQAVERLLASPEDQARLREENLAKVQRFSTPVVARMYDRALSGLIGASPTSPELR
jgi:glycosyltransferase involved in cell wall biosynthesis